MSEHLSLSIDEILCNVSAMSFYERVKFFESLDAATWVDIAGTDERAKVAWPNALMVLTQEQWNQAFMDAMK